MNKKLSAGSLLSMILTVAMIGGCLFGCTQAPSNPSSATSGEMTVTLEIDPTAAEGKVDLPTEDLALTSEDVELPEGSTAYDALAASGAILEGSSSYVSSINGLAESAAGASYGWLYEVNGEAPMTAANGCVLDAGDTVRWYYGSWDAN